MQGQRHIDRLALLHPAWAGLIKRNTFVKVTSMSETPEGFGKPKSLWDTIQFTLGETDNPLVLAGVLLVGGAVAWAAWQAVKELTKS